MPLYLRIIFSIVITIILVVWSFLPARFEILSPRLGMPAIVRAGDVLNVNLRTSIPFWQPHWQVSLLRRGQRIAMTNLSVKPQFNNAALSLTLPSTLSAGTYSLIVSDDHHRQVRSAALHIVKDFPDAMSIVQLADLPTLGNQKGDRQMQQLVDEINIINPTVVLMTGDVAYGGQWRQYRLLLAAMDRINAPVIAAPGNHEYEGWAAYLTLLGIPYHSVTFGKLQFVSLNSGHGRDQITESQYAWLKQTFNHLEGRVPIVQMHHPMLHRPGLHGFVANHVQDMVTLFHNAAVPIVLSGHWHGDAVYDETGHERLDTWNFPGVPYVTTTTAGADLREDYARSPMHHGYRLIRLDHGKLVSYTYDMNGDGERDPVSSIPVGKLHSKQLSDTSAQLDNGLNEDLDNARVEIKVPGQHLNLVSDTGHVVDRYLHNNVTVYSIELPLPANSRVDVHLREKESTS